jgi:hypothetical protein
MALVNRQMAYDGAGKFLLRFEDNIRFLLAKHGGELGMMRIAAKHLMDLYALDVIPDDIAYHSRTDSDVKRFLATSNFRMVIDHAFDGTWENAAIVESPFISPMRMGAWVTAQRVVLDRWQNIDGVIRGMDLIQEHHLYAYFCALFGFPFPKCYYLPRLMAIGDDGLPCRISKTDGNWRVRDLLDAGIKPQVIKTILREACLKGGRGSWRVENIVSMPVLNYRSMKELL